MTATTTAAAHAWNALVAGDWNAMQALDSVMEADGCERAAALKALHEAAADWLEEVPNTNWVLNHRRILDLILAMRIAPGRSFDTIDQSMYAIRQLAEMARDSGSGDVLTAWLPWCDKADDALARLRELTAIPGGES